LDQVINMRLDKPDVSTFAAQTHRIIVPRRGGPEVLQWVAMDMPEPGPDEVRVRLEAAGVSAYDVMLRGHWFPPMPYTPGEDFVGIVDKVGTSVTDLEVGQRVGGWTFGDAGGYAEYLCRPAADLVSVPDGLDPATACALIVNYLTASLALVLSRLRSGLSTHLCGLSLKCQGAFAAER
jgi:NADPH:quinone reductase-like Zn-dependent oxidoreductase